MQFNTNSLADELRPNTGSQRGSMHYFFTFNPVSVEFILDSLISDQYYPLPDNKSSIHMKPNRIILVRHGESEGNVERLNYDSIPDYALNLTSKGEEQAASAGAAIANIIGNEKIQAYISPFYRTRQTFLHIRKSINMNLVRVIEDPRIREQDWGHLRHPDDNAEISSERDKYSTFYYRIKDGESGADVYDRISTFLETVHRDFKKGDFPKNMLIVTHGLTLRLFLMRWFHWSVEEFEILRNPENCQVILMERKDDNNKYNLVTNLSKRA